MDSLDQLIANAKREFDLTESADQASLYKLADRLIKSAASREEIELADATPDAPLEFRIAAKLAESKRFVATMSQPVKVGVVFAMWGEHNRLQPKSPNNPHGEDSLRVKLAQLDWIADGTSIDWTLYAVDDGCPHGSGKLAAEVAADHHLGDRVRVLDLAAAVPTATGPLRNLASADDSRKGGAIVYGADQALRDGNDIVVYTDADNSVHLGQLGLLLEPFITDGIGAVWGDRKNPKAVLVKQEARWGIGIKVLRHMQRMVGEAIFTNGINDTQAAFKLYDRDVLAPILEDPGIFDFSFDTDWILAVLANKQRFARVPFAFIDSAAESASIVQGPMTTWETLLKGLVAAVRAHGVPHNAEMAKVVDEEIKSSEDLDLLIDHLPDQLEHATNDQLGDPQLMSPAELQAWIRKQKSTG